MISSVIYRSILFIKLFLNLRVFQKHDDALCVGTWKATLGINSAWITVWLYVSDKNQEH